MKAVDQSVDAFGLRGRCIGNRKGSWGLKLLAIVSLVAFFLPASALALRSAAVVVTPAGEDVVLTSAARDLSLVFNRKNTDGARAEPKLAQDVRTALNDWADLITALDLQVVVPEEAPGLVLGRASKKTLVDAASTLDDTWELFEPLREVVEVTADNRTAPVAKAATAEPAPFVVAVLLDREAMESDVWVTLLESLGDRKLLSIPAVRGLSSSPSGVTVRESGLFLQPTYDLAGNAAAGDDEFRVGNEVAHKFAVCWLRMRFGEMPTTVRWGFGYIAEQRLFHSIYQFDAVGFVAVEDHFDWPKRTVEALDAIRKSNSLTVAGTVMQQGLAGGPNSAQMISWGALDYLLQKEPAQLHSLLKGLGALHTEAAGRRSLPTFAGDDAKALALLDGALANVDVRGLQAHVKRVK